MVMSHCEGVVMSLRGAHGYERPHTISARLKKKSFDDIGGSSK